MRMTWGQMVDDILNDLDSDPVTLYDDTVESQQVSQILQTCYFNIVDSREWPHFMKTFTITQVLGSAPYSMTIPTDVKSIKWIKYNAIASGGTSDLYNLVRFLEPWRFMEIVDARTTGGNVVSYTDSNSIKYKIINNVAPSYWTTFDEQTAIFDSFNASVDTTGLLTAKTQCYGMKHPTLTISDGVYVDLPTNMFSLLLAEAKAASFRVLKQTVNPAAEFFAQSQRAKFQMDSWKVRENYRTRDFSTQPIQQPPQTGMQQGGQ